MAKQKGEAISSIPPLPPTASGGVQSIRDRLRKNFKADAIPDPLVLDSVDAISSGSLCLDLALGVGGFARGRISTFAGPQHAGKTALALYAIATIQDHILWTQQRKARVVILDTESAHSNSLARLVGCDTDEDSMLVLRPEVAEDALMMTMYALGYETKDDGRTWKLVAEPADVLLFDSWAGTPTEGVGMAELPRIGSQWLPTLSMYVGRAKAIFLLTNHIRQKPGVVYGDPEYEPGGEALKHVRTVATVVHATDIEKDENKRRVAHTMKIEIKKNKLAPAYHIAKARLDYLTGFDRAFDVVEYCKIKNISLKETLSGNIYKFDSIRETGERNFMDALRAQPKVLEQLIAYAMAQ